jgi:pantetheine-phosphate adenylyltransferase
MKSAVYAGTFDPVTLGHLSVIARAAELFDSLWIVIAVNPAKQPLFTPDERAELLRQVTARWPGCSVTTTEGYVVTLARSLGARYLVRGVRGATDVEAEITLAKLNRELAPEIETVFVPAHAELSEVSSSKLKQLAASGADLSPYCPEVVAQRLRARLGAGASEHV